MNDLSDSIKYALLDADGSCRDVNFLGASDLGIVNMIRFFEPRFGSMKVIDQNGEDVPKPMLQSPSVRVAGQRWHSVLRGGSSGVSQAQFSIFWNQTLIPEVEFTFFSQDIEDVTALLPLCHDIKDVLGATRYWVRYEDAQWTPEATDQSSVIFDSAQALTQGLNP